MSGSKPKALRSKGNPDPGLARSQSVRVKNVPDSREAHLREQMAEMEKFYEDKLSLTRSQLMMAENELRSFKDRMAEDLSVSLDAAEDTENMIRPVNVTRLQETYHLLRVNKWPKVKGELRHKGESPERVRNIIQGVFKEAVTRMDSVKKNLYTIFTENMSQKVLPKKVQDHLHCSLENLQLALFHSNKQDLRSSAVMGAPEACRELLSECYWLFSLMALSKKPLQPQWDSRSAADPWECLPTELTTRITSPMDSVGHGAPVVPHREDLNKLSDVGQHLQTPLDSVFIQLEKDILMFVKEQLKRFHGLLASKSSPVHPEITPKREEESSREAVLSITLDFLRRMNQEQLAEHLRMQQTAMKKKDHLRTQPTAVTHKEVEERLRNKSTVDRQLKSHLQQKFSQVYEGVATARNSALLQQIYTELNITEGGASEVYQEHEVSLIKSTSRKSADTPISLQDMFKQRSESGKPIRTVLTVGVGGVGKTLLTQKFSLDWSEDRAHQDIQLLFPFTFKDLNVLKDNRCSLVGLIHHFFGVREKELCSVQQLQVYFILDGLDECSLPLDFSRTRVLTEPTKSASVDELLVNLIRGNLLPSARLWITTRPKPNIQIPARCVSMVTEVQGFTDPQKEQYFRKKLRDKATDVISHIKSNPSLSFMSRRPGFCWILSNFIKKKHERPMTLTNLYIHFLLENSVSERDTLWKILQSVGRLAFEDLQKTNLTFYESDLSTFGLDDSHVACFTHSNVKEFLAALHVHQTFFSSEKNLLSLSYRQSWSDDAFYRSAVDWGLQHQSGHLNMFLCFLLGLSVPVNQRLLTGLLSETGSQKTNHEIVGYIKDKLNEEGVSAEKSLNLLHCLNELSDHSLLEETQKIMREGGLSLKIKVTPAQLSALCLLLLSSDLEEFDLKKFCPSEQGLQKLLPVVKASRKANLSFCDLKMWNCTPTTVLSSSSLTHLDLSNNNILDSGVMALCRGLKNPPCRLKTLILSCCGLSDLSCSSLASVLSSTSLTHLDLSTNDLRDLGVERLCDQLKNTPCRLETLRLSGCWVSEKGGAYLATALSSGPSQVRELDLSYNHPGPSAQRLKALQAPQGPLHSLRLDPAGAQFLNANLTKYFCELSLVPSLTNRRPQLSENNRTVTFMNQAQLYPDSSAQILCSPDLTGRHFWKVDFHLGHKASVYIGVTYTGKGDAEFGHSSHSWALRVSKKGYGVYHNGESAVLPHTAPHSYPARVAVYLDYEAGYLSFYKDYYQALQHLYTFHITFTEPVCAGFRLRDCKLSLVDRRATTLSSSFW